jgi:hypothetical protein
MRTMSKKNLLSFFTNLKFIVDKKQLLSYFEDFNNDTKFKVELRDRKIFITSLSGEVISIINVPSR